MNKDLEKLLDDFSVYKLKVEGKGEKSVKAYYTSCKFFIEDMKIKDVKDLLATKPQRIIEWLQFRTDLNNSPSTRNLRLTSLKLLFDYLEFVRDYDVDKKIQKIQRAKSPVVEKQYLTMEEISRMINMSTNARMKAAISILSNTGMRFSEMQQITCTDIENGKAIIVGKGKKTRTVYFKENCIYLCNIYINTVRRNIIKKLNLNTDLLFITGNGTLLRLNQFNAYLKKIAKRAGISWYRNVSAHTFRHSYVTKLIDDGVSINHVKAIVGHSNIATTNIYAHSNEEAIENIMKYHDDLGR